MGWGRQANRGKPLEEMLALVNQQYRSRGVAVIHKVPTAWIPLRDSRGRITGAKVEEKSVVDFLGAYGGKPVAFDAKHCMDDRIRWDRVELHQTEFLRDWTKGQGVGFVLVGFRMERFFVVPWSVWDERMQAWKMGESPASISLKQMLPEWEAPIGGNVLVDYLAVVDRLFFA